VERRTNTSESWAATKSQFRKKFPRRPRSIRNLRGVYERLNVRPKRNTRKHFQPKEIAWLLRRRSRFSESWEQTRVAYIKVFPQISKLALKLAMSRDPSSQKLRRHSWTPEQKSWLQRRRFDMQEKWKETLSSFKQTFGPSSLNITSMQTMYRLVRIEDLEVPFSVAECQTLQAYQPRVLTDENATALAETFHTFFPGASRSTWSLVKQCYILSQRGETKNRGWSRDEVTKVLSKLQSKLNGSSPDARDCPTLIGGTSLTEKSEDDVKLVTKGPARPARRAAAAARLKKAHDFDKKSKKSKESEESEESDEASFDDDYLNN
jgi:hypothetical protein